MEHSVATLEAKANVCCVKFNPATRYNIAFGSAGIVYYYLGILSFVMVFYYEICVFYTYQIIYKYLKIFNKKQNIYEITYKSFFLDHCVHYYDLRNPKRSLSVLKGHRKAVSYAKFLDSSQIVSA